MTMSEQEQEKTAVMTESEIKELVKETINVTLTSLGIDHENPIEMQKDNQYTRSARLGSEAVKKKAGTVFVGTGIAGILFLIVKGLKDYFQP